LATIRTLITPAWPGQLAEIDSRSPPPQMEVPPKVAAELWLYATVLSPRFLSTVLAQVQIRLFQIVCTEFDVAYSEFGGS
jgi:hypothetical protein